MEKRINKSITLMSIAATILCSVLIFCVMQVNASQQMKQSVRETSQMLSEVFNSADVKAEDLALKAKAGLRVTWVTNTGEILYDTSGATSNHSDRPEIQAAIKNGFGESQRVSDTLRQNTYYYAMRLSDGSVLRVSATTQSVLAQVLSCIPFILLCIAAVAVLSTFAAAALTKKLMVPIEQIDIENPMDNDVYEEFVPLLRRINHQNQQLSKQLDKVRSMRDELSEIMENMTEGLIVLSDNGMVLSINSSALNVLNQTAKTAIGQPLLALRRDNEFVALADAVEKGENMQTQLRENGRTYRAALSQVPRGGSILMLVDETDKCEAEQMRREFSANVSHELKTPLQSILGYAELLKNDIVKENDKSSFYNNIYTECQRLITLVQDIIDLSRLDEGVQAMPKENIDLLTMAEQIAGSLSEKAADKKVVVTVKGENISVQAVPALVQEMLYNLIDNAITYNRPTGTVNVLVTKNASTASVVVKDTGIGIPKEHQTRVFERFFRVDKSHSRMTGGTGLGLSIVKHAAALHGAVIDLQSAENKGTTVTITFPA